MAIKQSAWRTYLAEISVLKWEFALCTLKEKWPCYITYVHLVQSFYFPTETENAACWIQIKIIWFQGDLRKGAPQKLAIR